MARLSEAAIRVLRASAAPFLILIAPFAIFVQYQDYGFLRPEVGVMLVAAAAAAILLGAGASRSRTFEVLALAASLTFFADVQLLTPGILLLSLLFVVLSALLWVIRAHAAHIASLMVATVLALSLLPPLSRASAVAAEAQAPARDLPLIVHLVLDEQIGIEGLPADLTPAGFKNELRRFFTDRGFRVFGKAYSEYPSTRKSIGHLLNLVSGIYAPHLTAGAPSSGSYRLTHNAYFERLEQDGYRIRVYQPNYLRVCTSGTPASACHTYDVTSPQVVETLPFGAEERLLVLAGSFLSRSEIYRTAKDLYKGRQRQLRRANIQLPAWNWDRTSVGPVGTMQVIDTVVAELSKSRRGDFFYAHLLMPHYPYVYNRECQPRPPSQWLRRDNIDEADAGDGQANNPQSRAIRYARYFQQVHCAQRIIDRLMAAVPGSLRDDAIVIVHGDHGSRIGLVEPVTAASLTPRDYADYYSTLFAVRSDGAGYDERFASTTCLLRSLVDRDFMSAGAADACSSRPAVFLEDSQTPRPLPDFTADDSTSAASLVAH